MALFQYWNINRFPEVFHINREEIMSLSKIGGTATYHKCLRNLHDWKYLYYLPSYNPFKGSRIKMFIYETGSEQALNRSKTSTEQALIPNTNSIKQKENNNKPKLPKNENEVIDFFKSKKWPAMEGLKFYNHYQAIGWKQGGKIIIVDWTASASNWMQKAKEIKTEKEQSHFKDNLRTTKIKNYDEPL
jgi:hypothetical protein